MARSHPFTARYRAAAGHPPGPVAALPSRVGTGNPRGFLLLSPKYYTMRNPFCLKQLFTVVALLLENRRIFF
ncbi:MAG: hypothetical protein AVDCRST_MAG56-1605 [uncultured Cytophagales bacterium]|uniref:Uncharacterized protein n=1 Tax=uncultured Cytophagales bacterium TaxID=158755 RepID=A0A6J4I2B7_9SPHI|nr:MAG: hypothetical protein AVDCRST_MAG56-1605 [uncultured Cytophagales bacterium]